MPPVDKLGGRKTLKAASILDEMEKDRIKAGVDLVALFASFDVELTAKGKGFMGKCPWHEDATPSLSVDREKGLYNCFGCGESGDAFTLVEKMKGLSFRQALEYLKAGAFPATTAEPANVAGRSGPIMTEKPLAGTLQAPPPEIPVDKPARPEADKAASPSIALERLPAAGFPEESARLLDSVAEFYARELAKNREAQSYLERRGLLSWEILNRLGAGFCSGNLAGILSEGQKKELMALGVLRDDGREALEGCVVFPLTDESGAVLSFYGRKIDEATKVKHLYLKGPHRGLVNHKALSVWRDQIILTESILDAVSLMVLGIERVLPCYGTGGFTDEHLSALKDAAVRKVVIAFDSDDAGQRGTETLKTRLFEAGFATAGIQCPTAKDWNQELTSGITKTEIQALVSSAEVFVPEGKTAWKFDRVTRRWSLESAGLWFKITGVKEGFGSSLRVSARLEKDARKFIDTVDLYSARSRTGFRENAGAALDAEPLVIEGALIDLIDELEKANEEESETGDVSLTEEEAALGMSFLKSPSILTDIVSDMETLGHVGEEVNKLVAYLAASSRKLEDPVSVIVVSQSAAGKSFLIDTVRRLMPEEDVVNLTSLSDQALNYIPEGGLLHKLLILGEAVHNETVEHQVREMLSAKELSRMVVTKDERTGKLSSKVVRKKAVVSLMMSTTSREMNGENASRCFFLHADESEQQTRRIHEQQNKKFSLPEMTKKRLLEPEVVRKHKAAQRLLRPIAIVNPFSVGKEFPSSLMRSRRDNKQLNELAAAVCFIRQYQKEVKTEDGFEYIECDESDVQTAWNLFAEGVMKATYLELPESLVRLYEEVRSLCRTLAEEAQIGVTEASFEQAQVRKAVRWLGSESIKKYLAKLVSLEYLLTSGGYSRGRKVKYRLAYDESLQSLSGLELSNTRKSGEPSKSG